MNLKVIYKNIEEIKEYENNPRQNEEAVEKVIESIKEYDFLIPILIDKDNVIIAGHTRKKAAERLNLERIPCIYAENLTAEQVKKFRLVDNKTSEFSYWDMEKLKIEMVEIFQAAEMVDKNLIDVFEFPDFTLDNLEVADEDFIQPEHMVQKKQKTIVCPECGKTIEV